MVMIRRLIILRVAAQLRSLCAQVIKYRVRTFLVAIENDKSWGHFLEFGRGRRLTGALSKEHMPKPNVVSFLVH